MSSRDELFRLPKSGNPFDDDDDDEEIIDTHQGTSVQELRKTQAQMLEEQDQGLDVLAQVISRQKHLALRIGNEVETQNEIIDDLATTMDSTDARINQTTRRVVHVSEIDSTCSYYVIMGLLAAAILIVAFI